MEYRIFFFSWRSAPLKLIFVVCDVPTKSTKICTPRKLLLLRYIARHQTCLKWKMCLLGWTCLLLQVFMSQYSSTLVHKRHHCQFWIHSSRFESPFNSTFFLLFQHFFYSVHYTVYSVILACSPLYFVSVIAKTSSL